MMRLRAIGWFGMAIVELLELMPHNHAPRPKLLAQLRQLYTFEELR